MLRRLVALLSIAILLCGSAQAVPQRGAKLRLEGDGLVVLFENDQRAMAQVIFDRLPRLFVEIGAKLELPSPTAVEVVLCADRREASRWTRSPVPSWSAALALPDQNRILVQVDRLSPGNLRELVSTLKHEALHLLFGELPWHVRRNIPLWFEEGVAQVYASPLFEFDRDALALRVQIWQSPSLADWSRRFPEDGEDARTAYLYSEAMVRLFVRLWGSEVVPQILRALHTAESFGAAVVEVTGEPVVWHEGRLHSELASDRSVYVRSLYGFLGSLIFFAISPLLFVGFARVRRRRRERMASFEEQEARGDLDALNFAVAMESRSEEGGGPPVETTSEDADRRD